MKEKKETTSQTTELTHSEPTRTTTTTRTDLTPFGLMRRFAGDMERLFDDFEGFRFPRLFGTTLFPFNKEFEHVAWVPEIEVTKTNGKFTVHVDLPGLKKDEVTVEVTDNLLTISGERKAEKEEKREGYYRSERSYGSFYRQIPLPEGAMTDTATAEFKDGVLDIVMNAPERKPLTRQLTIKHGVETAKAKTAAA